MPIVGRQVAYQHFSAYTEEQVDAAFDAVDQQAVADAEDADWVVDVYDGSSNVCGQLGSYFLERDNLPADGLIYTISHKGNVVFVQPHDPFQSGFIPLTEDNVHDVSEKHRKQTMEPKIPERILSKIEKILSENDV